MLESDAKWVVDLINSGCDYRADFGSIFDDIVAISRQFNIPISFVPRDANKVAHTLAKFALRSDANCFWTDVLPCCLESVVLADSIPLVVA